MVFKQTHYGYIYICIIIIINQLEAIIEIISSFVCHITGIRSVDNII